MSHLVDTPIEQYELPGLGPIWVKREDLCCPYPGPPFSKIRGVYKRIVQLKSEGIKVVSYAESKISMASWGISWVCHTIGGIKAVIYAPHYKNTPAPLLDYHRKMWESLGGETRLIMKPNRGQINAHFARKGLREEFGDEALLFPMGLPFPETIDETIEQVRLISSGQFGCVLVCVGSGVIASGIIKGFCEMQERPRIYGVAIRHFDLPEKKKSEILTRAGVLGGLLYPSIDFTFINTDYEYQYFEETEPPFPCNPFYDRKAWHWLLDNYNKLEHPVLFWNIGAGGIVT